MERQKRKTSVLPLIDVDLVPSSNEKIDVVYLWVNGSDASWKYSMNAFSSSAAIVNEDNGSLLYSLRSLMKYVGDLNIGTIYIVTSLDQVPSWFDQKKGFSQNEVNLKVVHDYELMQKVRRKNDCSFFD